MKTFIEVSDRKEAKLIRLGLNDRQTRTLVKIMGALATLPSDRRRIAALTYVKEYLDELEGRS